MLKKLALIMWILDALYLTIILQNFMSVQNYEYCKNEAKFCPSKTGRHIVCYPEQLEQESEFQKMYPMTHHLRKWILYWHNFYRNQIACGMTKGYEKLLPKASQMLELAWDYELEYVAAKHAGRCNMTADECRNTARFSNSGQNLAYHKSSGQVRKPLLHAYVSISEWFEESKYTPMETILKNTEVMGTYLGHFCRASSDKIGRLGCALAYCKSFPSNPEEQFLISAGPLGGSRKPQPEVKYKEIFNFEPTSLNFQNSMCGSYRNSHTEVMLRSII